MNGEWLRLGIGGIVPISWDLTSKSDNGPGELEGWASVYNVVDQQDDIVVQGAFKKTLAEWRTSGRAIPLSKDHDLSIDSVIGSLTYAEELPYGLRVRASFASTAGAQEARTKARENHLNGLSIFGPIVQKGSTTREGRAIRVLREVGLLQVALTPYPANMNALLTKTASGAQPPDPAKSAELDPRWEEDMRVALRISSAPVRRVALESLIKARFPDAAAADVEPSVVHDVDTTEQAGDYYDASQYALGLIGESGPSSSPGGEPNSSLADFVTVAAVMATSAALTDLEAELRQAG